MQRRRALRRDAADRVPSRRRRTRGCSRSCSRRMPERVALQTRSLAQPDPRRAAPVAGARLAGARGHAGRASCCGARMAAGGRRRPALQRSRSCAARARPRRAGLHHRALRARGASSSSTAGRARARSVGAAGGARRLHAQARPADPARAGACWPTRGTSCELFASRADELIPSACLNSTVSGLISPHGIRPGSARRGRFHGVRVYREFADRDVSRRYVDTITALFTAPGPARTPRSLARELAPADGRGWRGRAGRRPRVRDRRHPPDQAGGRRDHAGAAAPRARRGARLDPATRPSSRTS